VEYPNSPEARYPVAIEQGYATAQWITREGATKSLDATRMAVAGESVGGDMTAALDTATYDEFATDYYLTRKAMEWFWDAYIPDSERRKENYASPNQAHVEQLMGLPPALLLVDEADVLRDEGESYAAKLRVAGVAVTTVRYAGVVHDFMLLNSMSQTYATRAAISQATSHLRAAFGHGPRDVGRNFISTYGCPAPFEGRASARRRCASSPGEAGHWPTSTM
jgi:acetyl esterase